eukprot:Ihof_evm12s90 gene=Ihof_evmTU12s90
MWNYKSLGAPNGFTNMPSERKMCEFNKGFYNRRQAMDDLLKNISTWQERSSQILVLLLLQLRAFTERDDIESQHCRVAASLIVSNLAEILTSYNGQTGACEIQILAETLACLRFVTKGEVANIKLATDCGVLPICRDVMRQHSDSAEIQCNCCMVFRSLTFNRADNQLYVVQIGLVSLIIKAMQKFKSNPTVQSAALMSIQNITWLVDDNRTMVERESGIQQIIQVMSIHLENVEVQKWACGALQNLACCVFCTMRLLELGALEVVLRAMRQYPMDPTVQNYGLGVLRNISYLKENRVQVAKSGAISLAIKAMKLHLDNIEVQNSAASFFFNTVIGVDDNCQRVLEAEDIFPILFAAKAAHVNELHFLDKTNAILDQLSKPTKGLYINLYRRTGPLSLRELCIRAAATQTVDNVVLPNELIDDIASSQRCNVCAKMHVSSNLVAYKSR